MKKFCFSFFILAVFIFALSPSLKAESAEKILSFDSDIKVHPDSSMTVTETIKVIAAGNQIKRGIFRDFPTRYKDRFGNNYVVGFELVKILRDGVSESYHVENLSNGQRVYIGQKNYFLPAGEYTYTLVYNTNRQLGFFKDHDELYWNVTGNGWLFPIDEASATVELPIEAGSKILSTDAYTGPMGGHGKNFAVSTDSDGRTSLRTTNKLAAHEGLTIVVSWPKGYVQEPMAQKKLEYFFRDNAGVLAACGGIFLLLVYYLSAWFMVGVDPAKGTIIPLFEPPSQLSPAAVRYVMNEGYDNKAFTASVINMAVKGHLNIVQENGVYTLIKLGKEQSPLTLEEQTISNKIFNYRRPPWVNTLVSTLIKSKLPKEYGADQLLAENDQDTVALKNINHERIAGAIEELKNFLKKNYEKIYFVTNRGYFLTGLFISIAVLAVSLMLCSVRPEAIFISVWLAIWTIAVWALLTGICTVWKAVFTAGAKAFALGGAIFSTMFCIPFIVGEIMGGWLLMHTTSIFVVVLVVFVVAINVLFYHLLKAPTLKGRAIMDKIEGFKMYLSVAEKNRLNALNPPEKTPELFEKYLPYALALGVEQTWAEQFAEVLKRAAVDTGAAYHPIWYSGLAWNPVNVSGFTSGLSNSLSTAIASASTAPGSSSGGGGGGSSGGGGGGGGGGGW